MRSAPRTEAHRRWASSALCLLAALSLGGCDHEAFFDMFVPEPEAAFAKEYVALLRARDFDAIESRLDPQLMNEDTRSALEQMAAIFPSEEPTEIRTLVARSRHAKNDSRFELAFQYAYPNNWRYVEIVLYQKDGKTSVTGFRVSPLPESLEDTNRFTLSGKGVAHYAFLALAIIIPLFIVYALVICARTPIPKRKWAWILFVLVGFGKLTLNWTTGETSFSALSIQSLGAGVGTWGPLAPWLVSISCPVGAIVFLSRRKDWQVTKPADTDADADADTDAEKS